MTGREVPPVEGSQSQDDLIAKVWGDRTENVAQPLGRQHLGLRRGDGRAQLGDGSEEHGYAPMGTAFFFKQWGGLTPKSGGRELDGRTWDDLPARDTTEVAHAAHV